MVNSLWPGGGERPASGLSFCAAAWAGLASALRAAARTGCRGQATRAQDGCTVLSAGGLPAGRIYASLARSRVRGSGLGGASMLRLLQAGKSAGSASENGEKLRLDENHEGLGQHPVIRH